MKILKILSTIIVLHYFTLPYSGKYRSLRQWEMTVCKWKTFRISVNGIHCGHGLYSNKYPNEKHISFDWREMRGISFSIVSPYPYQL